MIRIPASTEAAPYYFTYIERIPTNDIMGALEGQSAEAVELASEISEEKSLHRYAPGKWSFRQVLNHVNDAERVFLSRAFWFARCFDTPLPSFDQNVGAESAEADKFSWADHVKEFAVVRPATLAFFRNLPEEAWSRSGQASGYSFTVRALAYIIAGHFTHHAAILRERYL